MGLSTEAANKKTPRGAALSWWVLRSQRTPTKDETENITKHLGGLEEQWPLVSAAWLGFKQSDLEVTGSRSLIPKP